MSKTSLTFLVLEAFLVLFWVTFPLGQFGRILTFNGIEIYLVDCFIGLIALITFFSVVRSNSIIPRKFVLPWLILVVWMAITFLISPVLPSGEQKLKAFLYLLRFICCSSFLFTGILFQNRKPMVLYLMSIGFLGIAFAGFAQYIFFPYLGPIVFFGWDPHLYRLTGSFLDPGFTGIVLVFALLLVALSKKSLNLGRFLWPTLMSIFYVSLLLTYSRASYLALILSMGFVAVRNKSYLWLGKFLVFFVISVLLLPRPAGEGIRLERQNSLKARFENWSHAVQIFMKNPVAGVGYNAYRYAQENEGYLRPSEENHASSGSDSSWLLILATTGIIGGGLFIHLFLSFKNAGTLVKASFLALFFHAWFLNSLFYPWVLSWFALLVGVCFPKSKDQM